ncbi:MAG: hypothetical protein A2045_06985 [Rhodocyclales bacterium GWA2_65_20]|nr:MAG: hypothetical protein A2045_06985 [Rhodocyclales bacterium GWA2_65_20]
MICACFGFGFAHAQVHPAEGSATAAEDAALARLPKVELTPQLLLQFLVAEVAGHRGQLALAVGAYRDLAKETRDPRVAKRATEIALFARQYDAALEAARIWATVDAESQPAQQMLASLLAASGRHEELSVLVAKTLAAAGPDVGVALLRLNRIFARSADKAAVQKVIDDLTAPYLGVAEAHFVRAIAAFEAQDQIRARQEIERALALRPNWEQAALVRAQVTPRGPEMLAGLKNFVDDNPKANEVRLAYARALVGEKRFEEARQEFAGILASNPDNADVIYAVAVLSLQLNDPDLAEVHLKRLVELGYSEADSARLYLGQIAEEKKRWEDAIRWYSQVAAGEKYLAAQIRKSGVLAHTGRLDEARRLLQEARAGSARERVQLILGEAQLLREAGHRTDALAVLEGGLASQPDQPDLLYEAALAAEKIGRLDVLERYLRQLIQIKPDHAHAYNALGYSLTERGERLEEAQQLIDKALQIAPDDPFILDSKGWLLYRKGDTGAALDTLRKALALRADPEIAAHYGEVLWILGRRDEALKTWSEAAQASPGNEALATTIKRFKP